LRKVAVKNILQNNTSLALLAEVNSITPSSCISTLPLQQKDAITHKLYGMTLPQYIQGMFLIFIITESKKAEDA
jgi:hypothetical protein